MNADELITLLDQLAQRLTGPAEQVFAYAVRAQITGAAIWVAFGLSLIAGAAIAVWWVSRRDLDLSNYDRDFTYALTGMLAAGMAFGGVAAVAANLQVLINPEWSAIQSLLGR